MRSTMLFLMVPVLALGPLACNGNNKTPQVSGYDAPSREINKLIIDLYATDPGVQVDAARELGDMRADRPAVRDALVDAAKDNNSQVRMAASEALADLGSVTAMKELRDLSNSGYHESRVVYAQEIDHLRRAASQGDIGARSLLTDLGEKGTVPHQGHSQSQW